jgi:hypothetical protein
MASLKSGQEIEKVPKYIPHKKKGARYESIDAAAARSALL